jgi:hypothetical protein
VTGANVISLDEFRAARRGPDDDLPPSAPRLFLVGQEPPDPLRLDVFLARARVVMAEARRQQMHVVGA